VDPLTFYFDRCFGKRFPEALDKLTPPFTVEWHQKNKFAEEMADDEWLSIVGAKNWVVFSHDRKFHDDTAACAAIRQHKIGCFYLWGASVGPWEKFICFAKTYERFHKLAVNTQKPFVFRITYNFRIVPVKLP